ncbi:MAG: GntP family permease [Spirochaetales bacterium]|jgi:GntP family gluconate:H+ symporter|nr:GntP family permease [Spirochaetales bacterium]
MVSGSVAVILLVIAVFLIVVCTSKLQLNAFVVLIAVAFLYGIAIGLPLLTIKDASGKTITGVVDLIKNGFGGTLSSIGIVIIAGTIIGTILEKTGAALSITQAILKVVGNNRAPMAMSIAGYVVSIPVFCDSGFVILSPLNKALSAKTGVSMTTMAIALGTGLHSTHLLVPPTPGPIAAAANVGADLGTVIAVGAIVAIFSAAAGYFWATRFAAKYKIEAKISETYEDLVAKYKKLPGAFHSMLPLLLPIVLIILSSVASFPTKPFGAGDHVTFIKFIGDPVTALILGIFMALTLVPPGSKGIAAKDWMGEGVLSSALILAITGAGGSFGLVLRSSPMVGFIGETLAQYKIGVFLPFLLAMALKSAQGSGTVSLVTTSAIMAPLISGMGLSPVITVMAIGSGAGIVSHANDSYFWVVSQFSGMPVNLAYKTWVTATAVQGVAAFIVTFVLSFFI